MPIQNKFIIPSIVLAIVLSVMLYLIGYETPRENFIQFIGLYMVSFAVFYTLWLNKQQWKFKHFLILAIVLRLVLLLAAPELSNDFYRFIWDGELITRGVNPYAHKPDELISQGPFYNDQYMRMLYHGMGELSQGHYSCYPVLNQLFFYVPAAISDSITANIIILKLIIVLADLGVIFIGSKILELLKKPKHMIWLYGLNPFILLEFTGNLHFEGVMIFFTLLAIYYVLIDKWLFAAIFFGLAIHIKLIPFLLIPFLYKKMKWRRSLGFTALTMSVVLAFGAIMLNEQLFENFMVSIDLYFSNFEFNASIFYILREIGFATKGYDPIQTIGPILSKLGLVLIAGYALIKAHRKDTSIFTGMMFALVIYYAFATTVHPWYISLILIFSIFTKYKFALIWSLLVMLSYFAYSNLFFEENLLLIIVEYVIVFGIMIYEIIKNTSNKDVGLQLKSFFSD